MSTRDLFYQCVLFGTAGQVSAIRRFTMRKCSRQGHTLQAVGALQKGPKISKIYTITPHVKSSRIHGNNCGTNMVLMKTNVTFSTCLPSPEVLNRHLNVSPLPTLPWIRRNAALNINITTHIGWVGNLLELSRSGKWSLSSYLLPVVGVTGITQTHEDIRGVSIRFLARGRRNPWSYKIWIIFALVRLKPTVRVGLGAVQVVAVSLHHPRPPHHHHHHHPAHFIDLQPRHWTSFCL